MRTKDTRRLTLSANYKAQFPCKADELRQRIFKCLNEASVPIAKVEDGDLNISCQIEAEKALKLKKMALYRGLSPSKVLCDYLMYFPLPDDLEDLKDDKTYPGYLHDTVKMEFYLPSSLWKSVFKYAKNNKIVSYAIDHMRLPQYNVGRKIYHFYMDISQSRWDFLMYCSRLRGYYPGTYLRQLLYEDKIKSQFHNILTQGIAYYSSTNENR